MNNTHLHDQANKMINAMYRLGDCRAEMTTRDALAKAIVALNAINGHGQHSDTIRTLGAMFQQRGCDIDALNIGQRDDTMTALCDVIIFG